MAKKFNQPIKLKKMKKFEIFRNGTQQGEIFAKNQKEAEREVFAMYGRYLQVYEAENEKFARKCSITGEGMNEGYVIGDGDKYVKEHLKMLQHITDETDYKDIEEAFADDYYYYTKWEDEEDYQFELVNGVLTELEIN